MVRNLDVQYVRYYTAGSAAQKLSPAYTSIKPVLPVPKKRKVHKIYVDPVAVVGIVVAVCMFCMMLTGIRQLQQAQEQTVALENYVAQLENRNQSLQAQFSESYDLRDVERTALAMGMIPQEQATRVTLSVPLPEPEPNPTVWEAVGTFLTGLFA